MTATVTKKHPIRGFLYGIVFGLGLAMIAIGQKWAALGTWPPFIIFVVGVIVGTLWSIFGPAKAPKGPPPVGAESPPPDPGPATDPTEDHAADPVADPVTTPDDATAGTDGTAEGDELTGSNEMD